MHIEIISLLGAILGASMSTSAAIIAWMQKRNPRFALYNSKQDITESSESVLELANRDIRDLQIQIEKLELLLREKQKEDLQKS